MNSENRGNFRIKKESPGFVRIALTVLSMLTLFGCSSENSSTSSESQKPSPQEPHRDAQVTAWLDKIDKRFASVLKNLPLWAPPVSTYQQFQEFLSSFPGMRKKVTTYGTGVSGFKTEISLQTNTVGLPTSATESATGDSGTPRNVFRVAYSADAKKPQKIEFLRYDSTEKKEVVDRTIEFQWEPKPNSVLLADTPSLKRTQDAAGNYREDKITCASPIRCTFYTALKTSDRLEQGVYTGQFASPSVLIFVDEKIEGTLQGASFTNRNLFEKSVWSGVSFSSRLERSATGEGTSASVIETEEKCQVSAKGLQSCQTQTKLNGKLISSRKRVAQLVLVKLPQAVDVERKDLSEEVTSYSSVMDGRVDAKETLVKKYDSKWRLVLEDLTQVISASADGATAASTVRRTQSYVYDAAGRLQKRINTDGKEVNTVENYSY
jgi:YD repeat-containing protein